jgi:hypothetical protein
MGESENDIYSLRINTKHKRDDAVTIRSQCQNKRLLLLILLVKIRLEIAREKMHLQGFLCKWLIMAPPSLILSNHFMEDLKKLSDFYNLIVK